MAKLSSQQKQFLNDLLSPVAKPLRMAWLATVFAAIMLVVQAWALAHIFATWLDDYFTAQSLSTAVLWQYLPWLVLAVFARPALQTVRELLSAKASLTVKAQLRQRLLAALAVLGPARSQFGSDGSLSSQVIEQTDALDGFVSRFAVQKKVVASTPLVILLAVASQSLVAAGILLLTAPLVPVFMILIGRMTASKSAQQFAALSQLSGRFLDWVRGLPTLKRLQATHLAESDLAYASEDYRRRTMDVLKIAFLNGAVLELLSALCIALVAVYLGFGLMGVLPWDKNHVPVAYFGAVFILLLVPEFYAPLRQLGADYHAKAQAEGAVQSLLPILNQASNQALSQTLSQASDKDKTLRSDDTNNCLADSPSPLSLPHAPSLTLKQLAIYADVAAADFGADFAPDVPVTQRRTRLAPISFTIHAGERIALMGESGSGKSSLLQAVMGFAHFEGEIMIGNTVGNDTNGIRLANMTAKELVAWRSNISYLAQTVALLPMSIADNLRLAKPDASTDELITALEQVQLWSLIEQLPEGMDTLLGERGSGLSGGQAQRLGLAQLLLQDAPLWLLDEPTEHLDPDTKDAIHELLGQVSVGKTVIWVTHDIEQLPWLDGVIGIQRHRDKPAHHFAASAPLASSEVTA